MSVVSVVLARFWKVNLSNAKNWAQFFSRPNLIYGDQESLWLLNVIEDNYQFLGVHMRLSYVRFGSLLGCLQIIFL